MPTKVVTCKQAEMEAMKGSVTSKDLNLLSEQLGKDAVTRVHRWVSWKFLKLKIQQWLY